MKWPYGLGQVHSPSREDHQAEILQLRSTISDRKTVLERSHVSMKAQYKTTNQMQRIYQSQIDAIKRAEARLSFCESITKDDLIVGEVRASSGFRVSNQGSHALDWALVRINKERLGGNIVSSFTLA